MTDPNPQITLIAAAQPASTTSKNNQTSTAPPRLAHPLHVQELEMHLDLNKFIDQLDVMFSEPIVDPSTSSADMNAAASRLNLSVKDLWPDETTRKKDLSVLYNFDSVGKRKWLKNILLEDSDSDSDSEEHITDVDIRILLKIHKYRRKYQKRYHTDILNSQYTYYAAGLLSEKDRHPDHQRYIMEQYGFTMPELAIPVPPPAPVQTKRHSSKRRRSSVGPAAILAQQDTLPLLAAGVEMPVEPSPKKIKLSKSQSVQQCPATTTMASSITATTSTAEFTVAETTMKVINVPPPAVEEKSVGFFDPALKQLWKQIVTEDIPKAHTEKYIAKTYRTIVLKNIAMSCASFLQQAKSGNTSGKTKSRQKRQQKNEPIGLRPISAAAPKSTPTPSTSNSS